MRQRTRGGGKPNSVWFGLSRRKNVTDCLFGRNHLVKTFFVLMLTASVVSVACELVDGLQVMSHNHFSQRQRLLIGAYPSPDPQEQPEHVSTSLGLTQKELAQSDAYVAKAYTESVRDGYRLGNGYSRLCLQCLCLSVLLFVSSLFGVCTVKRSLQTPAIR